VVDVCACYFDGGGGGCLGNHDGQTYVALGMGGFWVLSIVPSCCM
jgi:hypothetical protein